MKNDVRHLSCNILMFKCLYIVSLFFTLEYIRQHMLSISAFQPAHCSVFDYIVEVA